MERKFKITDARGGAAFTVRVVTRSRQREIVGIQDDGALKVRLTNAPAKANEELIEFLAEKLQVDVSQIEIVAGEKGREKIITVEGITPDVVDERLKSSAEA
jgi:hypothetical protein